VSVFLTPNGLTYVPASSSATPDLVAAVAATLRADPGTSTAFGQPSGPWRVYSDEGLSDTMPYAVITEAALDYAPESPGTDGSAAYTGRGEVTVDVYAATKVGAKSLRQAVIAALNDADLANGECVVHYFRQARPVSPPTPGTNVGVAQAYRASVTFSVITETSL